MNTENLQDVITRMLDLRAQRAELNKQDKKLKGDYDDLSSQALNLLEDMGVDSASLRNVANVSVSRKNLPCVKDWDELYRFINDNGYYHLLQKRVSTAAFEELRENMGEVPGTEVFEDIKLNLKQL